MIKQTLKITQAKHKMMTSKIRSKVKKQFSDFKDLRRLPKISWEYKIWKILGIRFEC